MRTLINRLTKLLKPAARRRNQPSRARGFRPCLEALEGRAVPATFAWQNAWQVTLEESLVEQAYADTAFGASATADGEITDIGQAGDEGPATATARAFTGAGQYKGNGDALGRVSFWRTFELSGSGNGWNATLDAALEGDLHVDVADGEEGDYPYSSASIAATIQIAQGTKDNPGTVTHLLDLGDSVITTTPDGAWVSQSGNSAALLADGIYTVTASLESQATVVEYTTFGGNAYSDFFAHPYGLVVNIDAVPDSGALPALAIREVTVSEGHAGSTAADFTVALSAPSTETVAVNYATADDTARAGSDYQAVSGTLTFAPGETSKTVSVQVNGDRVGEWNETFFVNLSGATGASIVDGQGAGTIVDDEPGVSIGDATVTEGHSDTTAISFTVALSAAYDTDVIVSFATQNSSAATAYTATTDDDDYQAASGDVTFLAGETSKSITILVNGDLTVEADETFVVNLDSTTALVVGRHGVGTILNDDPATKFYVVDSSSDKTFEYGPTGQAVENYALRSGNNDPRGAASTASGDRVWVIDNDDYVYVYDAAGTALGYWKAKGLSTPEGIASDGTDLWIVDRGKDRVFRFAGGASRTSGSASATSSFALHSGNKNAMGIETDGTHLWVVNDTSTDKVFKYTVGGSLVGSWTLTGGVTNPTGITLDPSNPSDVWVVDATADDVFQYSGAATRTGGSQAADAVFALAAGNSNPQGIADPPPTIADGQRVGTIVDDEPRVSISDVTTAEGRRGETTLFTFTVTLSAAYDQAVTMSFRTVNGTATTSDGDYIAKTGTLTFAPGETTKTITIEVKGDSKKEANETFYLDLFGLSSNSLFTKKRGLATILNDD